MAKGNNSTVPDVHVQKPQLHPYPMVYQVTQTYAATKKAVKIEEGYILKECTDRWYQVFYANGDKAFLRVGPELMKVLSLIEVK